MLSIIIPVWNQHEMTKDCLEAIRANTKDYEIVLIDNGSDPPIAFSIPDAWARVLEPGRDARYVPMVEGAGNIQIIYNETNLGFPVAINQGIRAAKGDIIVLLNNDVIVTENWLNRLEWHLLKYDVIGPMTNYCAGLQQATIPVYNDEAELNEQTMKWQIDHAFQSQEVVWIIGFCMAFKKSLYDELGSFDESLWPCSGEELDFCLRARAAGYKVGIAKDVYIHHFGSMTFKALMDAGQIGDYNLLCNRNENHVSKKWGSDDWKQQEIEETNANTIHVVMPFSRLELMSALIQHYEPMNIILHPIMFQDEAEKTIFMKPWISPFIISGSAPEKKLSVGISKINQFILGTEIIDNDYYITQSDLGGFEANVFTELKKMNDDVIIISCKRGHHIPIGVTPERAYPTTTLVVHPDNVRIGCITGDQYIVKGNIFKQHLYNEESCVCDGEMAMLLKKKYSVRYEPNLFSLFHYFELGRWDK